MTKIDKIKTLINLANTKDSAFIAMKNKLTSLDLLDEEKVEELSIECDKLLERYEAAAVKIYDRWLSEEAVDAAIAFYSSSIGAEVINNMPHIVQELTDSSMKMMTALFKKVVELSAKNPYEFGEFGQFGTDDIS